MIKPTVGRVVWYHPQIPFDFPSDQVHSAQIAYVHSDNCVNLGVLDSNGVPYNRISVFLWDGEGERPTGPHAEWMPYQLGQAAKEKSSTAV